MSELSPEDGTFLLRLARASVADTVLGERSVEKLLDGFVPTPQFEQPRGAFVSLKLPPETDGGPRRLHGCIGNITSSRPLYRNVIDLAAKSACEDPRFPPVATGELPGLYVEVSALTRMTEVEGPEAVRPGVHGVQLTKGGRSAVFLPQVAGERGWGVEETLTQLALKAGLPRDGWVGARLSVFQAEVFGDP